MKEPEFVVKDECDGDYFCNYFSKDGMHKWEVNKTMVR